MAPGRDWLDPLLSCSALKSMICPYVHLASHQNLTLWPLARNLTSQPLLQSSSHWTTQMLLSRALGSELTTVLGWGCPGFCPLKCSTCCSGAGIRFSFGFPGWPTMYSQVGLSVQGAMCVPASPSPASHILSTPTLISPSPDGLPLAPMQLLCVAPRGVSLGDSVLGKAHFSVASST